MKKIILCFVCLFSGIVTGYSANRFWIAASTSNWNNTANWSTISGGSGGASVPGVSDIAIFDNLASGNCNITTTITVSGLTINGYTGNLLQGANTLSIGAMGFAQNSGTFTGGSANMILNDGDFTLGGGTFVATSASFFIGGVQSIGNATIFAHSAGTFSHNNGKVIFNPTISSCTQYTYSIDVSPTTLFYDVEINSAYQSCGVNHVITTLSGDVLNALNNFTHTDGIINGSFTLDNNLIINANADGGPGTITFDGTGAQSYFQATGSPRTCMIAVNKTVGAVTPSVGAVDFSMQGFNQIQGNFTAPPGSLKVGGPSLYNNQTIFNHQAGTFSHNNGKTVFDPTANGCPQYTYTIDVLPSTLFYDVEINSFNPSCGVTHIVTTASMDVVNATHDFIHTDGIINGLFTLDNNLIINTTADPGTGTITFDGTGAQSYFQAAGSQRTCKIAVNKTAGAVTPSVGTVDFNTQGFNQIKGDFTAPPGSFRVGGRLFSSQTVFAHQAGTFSHNNGTVIFDPAATNCTSYTYSVDVLPGTFFYDVEINLTTYCGVVYLLATAAGDAVNAMHDITHTDGVISGLFTLDNNLTIAATAKGGTGTITFDGTGAQTYFQAVGSPRTCKIAVNKTSGGVTPAMGAVDFSTQGFDQVQGDFTAPTGNFKMGGTINSNVIIFRHLSGTFTHNNTKAIFDPSGNSCTGYSYSVDVIPASLFYDIEINMAPTCGINYVLTTVAGDVVNATHDITHTDGLINGLFTLDNNLTINATADGGTGTITFDGTGAQTYFQASGSPRTCKIAVNKTSGAVTPSMGNVDLATQGFDQQLGDFTAPNGNFKIGGPLTSNQFIFRHQAGTFAHNNGKVTFDAYGNCSSFTYSVDVLPSTSFYNITVGLPTSCNGIAHAIATAVNDSIMVNNLLNYTSGSSYATMEALGNVYVSSAFTGGAGRLIFSGPAAQTFSLAPANNLFNGPIVLNKSLAKNVTLLSPCILDAGASQTLVLNKGVLVTTSVNLLTVGNAGTVSNANDSSYVNGPVQKVGNQAFIFPVGKQKANGKKYYRSIRISAPTATTDAFTAEYFPVDPSPSYTVSSKDPVLNTLSRCEYWILDRSAGSASVSVTLSWRDSTSCGITNPANLRVARWDGSMWKDQSNGGYSGSVNSGTLISGSAITAFSPFTLGSADVSNALPIELVYFSGTCNDRQTQLQWATASEHNNRYFALEQSDDGLNWKMITSIDGSGTSTELKKYNLNVLSNDDRLFYYRLKQGDQDGSFNYSNVVAVDCHSIGSDMRLNIYPNPSKGIYNIFVVGDGDEHYSYKLYNDLGQLVYFSTEAETLIDLADKPNGIYVVLVTVNGKQLSQKIVKEN